MGNNTYEQEIDLKELMFAVLRSWRPLMAAALLLAALLGGYKSWKEFNIQSDKERMDELQEQYEADEVRYAQLKNGYEEEIEILTQSIEYQGKYREESILLKINPYSKPISSIDLFVTVDQIAITDGVSVTSVDPADSIVKAYALALQQGGFLEELSKEVGISYTYLKELLAVSPDYSSNMLSITVTHSDESEADRILDIILGKLESIRASIQEQLDKHNLIYMNHTSGVVVDQNLASIQNQKVTDLATANKKLEEKQKALEELEELEKPASLSKWSIAKEGLKYGVIAFFGGAFLAAFIVCATFLLNGRMNTNDDLKSRFGLRFFGGLSEARKKKAFGKVDQWLDQLEGKEILTDEKAYDIIAANIFAALDQEEAIFVTGMLEKNHLTRVAEELQKRLSGIRVGYGEDMLHNVETIKNAKEAEAVILLECCRTSRMRDIEKELETLSSMKKQIMGYAVVNSDK